MTTVDREASGAHSEPDKTVQEKIRRALGSTSWDGLVVVGVENVQYCSGAWSRRARGYLDRPSIVVWPRDGEPTYVTGAEWLAGYKAASFITQFVAYEEKSARPPAVIVDTVAQVLKEHGLSDGRIGLEMLRTPVPFYERLRQLVPRARFEPADEFLWTLRMVKTQDELKVMREGSQRTDQAVWEALKETSVGDTERELANRIQLKVFAKGCDAITNLLVGTGEGARKLGVATDRRLQRGDVLRVDLNSIYGGYFVDIGRTAVVGVTDRATVDTYRNQLALRENVVNSVRSGLTCESVYLACREDATRRAVTLFHYPYIGIGHGIGVNNDEFPKLNVGDSTPIRDWMVLNIEPDILGPAEEIFHVEDSVVVGNDGKAETITWSRDWSELHVVG